MYALTGASTRDHHQPSLQLLGHETNCMQGPPRWNRADLTNSNQNMGKTAWSLGIVPGRLG